MSLHLDYRAETLDQIVGNETTIKTIQTIFERERKDIPHVFLFIGPGGCGKTTAARIVSKMLGCDPIPANQDFSEINAASDGGVDKAREIQKNMVFSPMNAGSKCRVFLLEEVHRSSDDFRKAMLNKCLEFTPNHVYFILCTTEPEKLGPANGPFRRRCHTFEMKKLSSAEMSAFLWSVIQKEGVKEYFNQEIVDEIVREADGSTGAALNVLDKIIDLDTEDMLAAIKISEKSKTAVIDLSRKLLSGNWADVRKILFDDKTNEFLLDEDPESIRRMVLGYMAKVLLKQPNFNSPVFARALLVMECFEDNFFNTGKSGLAKACASVFV